MISFIKKRRVNFLRFNAKKGGGKNFKFNAKYIPLLVEESPFSSPSVTAEENSETANEGTEPPKTPQDDPKVDDSHLADTDLLMADIHS